MITSRFPLGDVSFTSGYFATLVGEAAKQCYGVAAMAPRDMTDAVRSMVHGSDYPEKGVRVTQEDGRLVIELHIAVSYGLNISTAARKDLSPRQGRGGAGYRPEGCPRCGFGRRCDRLIFVGSSECAGLFRQVQGVKKNDFW